MFILTIHLDRKMQNMKNKEDSHCFDKNVIFLITKGNCFLDNNMVLWYKQEVHLNLVKHRNRFLILLSI